MNIVPPLNLAKTLSASGTNVKQPNLETASSQLKLAVEKKANAAVVKLVSDQDYVSWKRRQKLPDNAKLLIVRGPYKDVREVLTGKYEFLENERKSSPYFDFLWTLKESDVPYRSLKPHQIVNHFEKNHNLITKQGLYRNLNAFAQLENRSSVVDSFLPRSFCLSELPDVLSFIDHFIFSRAMVKMKRHAQSVASNPTKPTKIQQLEACLQIASRFVFILRNSLNESVSVDLDQGQWAHFWGSPTMHTFLMDWITSMAKRHKNSYNINPGGIRPRKNASRSSAPSVLEMTAIRPGLPEISTMDLEGTQPATEALNTRVAEMLQLLESLDKQYVLSVSTNTWIVKLGRASRGRGIRVFKSLVWLKKYLNGDEQNYVVQKYIESPMLLNDRKFDIRQWVLVTSWNPLVVWFYDESYVRVCSAAYDASDVENKMMHLSNYSIQRKGDNFDSIACMEGNMLSSDVFGQKLGVALGDEKVWKERVQMQMKEIVIWSLMSVQDVIVDRAGSFEHFGYDFMLDSQLNPWLIEVNGSPHMRHATPVLSSIITHGIPDMLKIVLCKELASKKRVGRWHRICKKKADSGALREQFWSKQRHSNAGPSSDMFTYFYSFLVLPRAQTRS